MRTKKVNRYYCDYCKKSGCSASHMSRHEKRCTMNPNRKCGVCGLMEEEQPAMSELLKVLPKASDYPPVEDEFGGQTLPQELLDLTEAAMPRLRKVANNCPACILAAIRQSGVPVPAVSSFDFTTEMKGVWSDFNDADRW